MNSKATNLDKELDDLLAAVTLPSDEQVRKETFSIKQSQRSRAYANSPAWKDKHEQGIKRNVESPQWKETQRKASEKRQANIEGVRKQKERTQEVRTQEEYQKNWREGMQKRNNDPTYRENLSKGHKKRIQTKHGIFDSLQDAATHMKSLGISNAKMKLYQLLKSDPTNYFYLDKPMTVLKTTGGKACHCPLGDFKSAVDGAQAMNIHEQTFRDRIKSDKHPEYYYINK